MRPSILSISFHANERLRQRGITRAEIEECLRRGIMRPDGHSRNPTFTFTLAAIVCSIAMKRNGTGELMSAWRK